MNTMTSYFTSIKSGRMHLSGSHEVYIVYVIESAAYGVICTSCLCQKPERARYEVRGLLTQTTSAYNPVQSTFYDVSCLLHVTREFSLK